MCCAKPTPLRSKRSDVAGRRGAAGNLNRKLAHLAATLRYFHLSCPLGPIRPLHQLLTTLVEKLLRSCCLHCRERHSINSRSSIVGLGLAVGFAEGVWSKHPIALKTLRYFGS